MLFIFYDKKRKIYQFVWIVIYMLLETAKNFSPADVPCRPHRIMGNIYPFYFISFSLQFFFDLAKCVKRNFFSYTFKKRFWRATGTLLQLSIYN